MEEGPDDKIVQRFYDDVSTTWMDYHATMERRTVDEQQSDAVTLIAKEQDKQGP